MEMMGGWRSRVGYPTVDLFGSVIYSGVVIIGKISGPWDDWKRRLAELERELVDGDIGPDYAEVLVGRVGRVMMLLNMVRWGRVSLKTADQWAKDEGREIGHYPGWLAMMELQGRWMSEGKWIKQGEFVEAMERSYKEYMKGFEGVDEASYVGDVYICDGVQGDDKEGGKDYA